MRLEGKISLVTGTSRGIGLAIAELFAKEGAAVFAGSSSNPDGAYPDGIAGIELDVAQEAHWDRAVDDIKDKHGRIDVLVNNAGIIVYDTLDATSTEDWQRVVDVNQSGIFFGMRKIIPIMQKQKGGSIVNVSSIWGNAAVAGGAVYHATKGAVGMMSKNAAITYAKDGIRVNTMSPGFIDTPLTQAQDKDVNAWVVSMTPMGRAGTPEEIANGCLFMASDEASFMTGAEMVIDGGYLAQ